VRCSASAASHRSSGPFLGAANDSIFKNAFVVFVTFEARAAWRSTAA
jgi:hypothetical protein